MKKIMSALICFILTLNCIMTVGAYSFNNNGTASKKATAYRLPSVNSSDIWWVDANDKLEVLCKDGDFYLVLYPFNNTGKHVIAYVPTSAVSVSNVSNASDFYQNKVARTNSQAILYHNPSTGNLIGASGKDNSQRAIVSKGEEIVILFEKDGFYCVRTSNDTGFIEKSKICKHSNISRQKISSGLAKNINNATYHSVKNIYREICNDCGIIVNDNIAVVENEKHSIVNNKCTGCGYIISTVDNQKDNAKCSHKHIVKQYQNRPYECKGSKNDKVHIITKYYNTFCSDCQMHIQYDLIEEIEEEHEFVDDECVTCGYKKAVSKPGQSTVSVNKTNFTPGETIALTWTAASNATKYDIHIEKEGMTNTYRIDSGFSGTSGSITINDEGTYTLAIYPTNSAGYVRGSSVKITVKKTSTEKTAYVYNTDGANLNMRSAASKTSSIVTKIPAGAEITVTDDAVSGFYPVKYAGKSGYASTLFITFSKPNTSTTNVSGTTIKTKYQSIVNSVGWQTKKAYQNWDWMCGCYATAYIHSYVDDKIHKPSEYWASESDATTYWSRAGGTRVNKSNNTQVLTSVKAEIDKGKQCVIRVNSSYGGHYVLVISYTGSGNKTSDFTILDPWDGKFKSLSNFTIHNTNKQVVTFK